MKDLKNRFDILADAADAATADLKDLDNALRSFSDELSAAIAEAEEALSGLKRSSEQSGGGGKVSLGGDAGVGDLSTTLESLGAMAASVGAQMRGALYEAMTPLLNIGNTMNQQINAVGGTFTTLARRIDAAMKFPAIDKFLADLGERAPEAWQKNTLSAVRTGHQIYSVWSSLGDVAGKGLGKIAGVRFNPVTASVQKLSISIKQVNAVTRQAGASMASFGRSALAAFGFVGVAWSAVSFLRTGVKSASNLNETINKFESILGEAAPKSRAFADKLSADFGLVKQQVLDAEAAFGGLGKGLGQLKGDKLSDFSNKFTQLAADLSSFANLDMGEAVKALQTGLAGNQSDVLKGMGVILTDEAVKARAVAEGFAKTTKEVSESAKVQARALIISEALADANGDLAKTASSPANMYRRLTGTINNLATIVGQAVMPVVAKIGSALTSGLQQATVLWESNKETVTQFQAAAFLAFESIKEGISGASELLSGFPEVLNTVFGESSSGMVSAFGTSIVDSIGAAVTGIGSFLRNIPEYVHIAMMQAAKALTVFEVNLDSFSQWFSSNWVHMIVDALNVLIDAWLDYVTFLGRLLESVVRFMADPSKGFHFDPAPFLESFKATTSKLPELIQPDLKAMNDEIDKSWEKIGKHDQEIRDKVGKDVAELNKPAAPNAAKKPGEAAKEEDKKDKKDKLETAGALELGSKEAYSAIAKAASGDRMLKEAKKQTALLTQIAKQKPSGRAMAGDPVPVFDFA